MDRHVFPLCRSRGIFSIRSCAGLAVAILLAGCGKPAPPPIVPAEGVVLLEGVPLRDVEVRFVPSIPEGFEYAAVGTVDKKGRFTLSCNGELGAVACENRVIVKDLDLPPHLKSEKAQAALVKYLASLGERPPKKYTNLVNNPLVVNVTAGQKEYKIELKR